MKCLKHDYRPGSTFIYSHRRAGDVNKLGEIFTPAIDCQKPNYLRCFICLDLQPISCGATWKHMCEPCARKWRSQQCERLSTGLKNIASWLEIALTRPGKLEFPWDKSKCNHGEFEECSGTKGCKVEEADMAISNTEMSNDFNRWLEDVRRLFGSQVQYAKVYETQARGLLHAHVLLTGLPMWPVKRLSKELKRLARKHNFGKQTKINRVVGDSPRDRARAVAYVTKYLTKGSELTYTVNKKTGEIRKGGYWRLSASRKFAPSLRRIKELRSLRFLSNPPEGGELDSGSTRSVGVNEAPPLDYLNLSYANP